MKEYNLKKFYLSIFLLFFDFVFFIFFVLLAEKYSFCNILAFLFFIALPILFIWFIICLIGLIKFSLKNNKTHTVTQTSNNTKYKDYNYSYENYKIPNKEKNNKNNQMDLKNYKKEHQNEYLTKLKMEFVEENNIEVNFENNKHCIFADNEENFDFHNDYNENGYREYFLFNNKWCFFDYDDEELKYKLVICNNKLFYTDCYIDEITSKTKKLLSYIKKNPAIHTFYEADLKNQEKILKTGNLIKCLNCNYEYYSDNKKCPNCKMSTKESL